MEKAGKSKARERLFTVFFMFAVTFVFVSAVSALQLATRETVAQRASLYLKRAVLDAAGLDGRQPAESVLALYDKTVVPAPGAAGPPSYLVSDPDTGAARGTVHLRDFPGLWGTIRAAVGVRDDGFTLSGLSIVEHNETPGLGARITEPWFENQFAGRKGPFKLVPEGTRSAAPGEIDAVTGATVTSAAVRDMLNRLAEKLEQ